MEDARSLQKLRAGEIISKTILHGFAKKKYDQLQSKLTTTRKIINDVDELKYKMFKYGYRIPHIEEVDRMHHSQKDFFMLYSTEPNFLLFHMEDYFKRRKLIENYQMIDEMDVSEYLATESVFRSLDIRTRDDENIQLILDQDHTNEAHLRQVIRNLYFSPVTRSVLYRDLVNDQNKISGKIVLGLQHEMPKIKELIDATSKLKIGIQNMENLGPRFRSSFVQLQKDPRLIPSKIDIESYRDIRAGLRFLETDFANLQKTRDNLRILRNPFSLINSDDMGTPEQQIWTAIRYYHPMYGNRVQKPTDSDQRQRWYQEQMRELFSNDSRAPNFHHFYDFFM